MKKDTLDKALTLQEQGDANQNDGSINNQSKSPTGEKMTIYEYQQKYVKRQNVKGARLWLKIIATLIGVFMGYCLFSATMQIWQLNTYAGIAAAVVSVAILIIFYIVPLVKISKSEYFMTNVNSNFAVKAQAHNKKLRHSIAEKIIDFNNTVEGVGWYEDEVVQNLSLALKEKDEEQIKACLTNLYSKSVKKSAKSIIFSSSLKSAAYSAISQANAIDAMLVSVINLQMVKDIVYLYGFRPSDAKLVKIFARVLQNSLIAYGLGGMQIGNGVVKTLGDAMKGIPILGTAISAVVDSSIQGLANGVLTATIGFQTIKYLSDEYKLQTVLDGIEVQTQEEYTQTCEEIKKELKKSPKKAA
ncbi:MAG: DUF697 domain-containing protein [Clostridiales bacterium]|nr:DUF697 domain-containing protein [Clostridiales bacterium]